MSVIDSWWPFARYSNCGAAMNGKKDGRHGIPDENQEKQPAYVLQLKQVGEENIERISQEWKKQDSVFLAEYCKAKSNIADLTESLKRARDQAGTALNEEKEARSEYTKHFHVTPFWYRFMMLAIAILEVPLNSIVFQLFGEARLLTLFMSLGIGILLPLGAHFLGGLLRHGFLRVGKLATETWMIVALIVAAIGTLGGIAYLREKFLEGSGVQKLLGLTMDITTVTVIFFVMNLLIFVVAVVAAYVAHDPIATSHLLAFEAASKLRRVAERKANVTEIALRQTKDRLDEIRARRQKSFERARHEVEEVRNIIQRVMSIYEQYNQRSRGSTKKPLCFEHYPQINTRDARLDPHNDPILEWECSGATSDVLPAPPVARAGDAGAA